MADTISTTTDQCAVLIVAPNPDSVLQSLGASLTSGGAAVQFTPDVYMAMARLARGEPFGHIVVEAAALDEYERAFLTLAPDYFPSVAFYVPIRSALDERITDNARYEALTAAGITDAILGIRDAEIAEAADDVEDEAAGAWGEPRVIGDAAEAAEASEAVAAPEAPTPHGDPPAGALSTDGGLDHQPEGPTLHDAVRERMGFQSPPPRRRPPGGSDDGPIGGEAPEPPRVTREEMNALLGEDDDDVLDAEESRDDTEEEGA